MWPTLRQRQRSLQKRYGDEGEGWEVGRDSMVCCCILQYEYAGEPDEEGNPTTRPGKVVHVECND